MNIIPGKRLRDMSDLRAIRGTVCIIWKLFGRAKQRSETAKKYFKTCQRVAERFPNFFER